MLRIKLSLDYPLQIFELCVKDHWSYSTYNNKFIFNSYEGCFKDKISKENFCKVTVIGKL